MNNYSSKRVVAVGFDCKNNYLAIGYTVPISMKWLRTKLDNEKVNLLSILSTTAVSAGASFLMVLGFANLLPASNLGTYQYIISAVSIIGAFSMTGIAAATIRATSRKDYFFLKIAKKYLLIGSVPAFSISLMVGLYYILQENVVLGIGIFLASCLFLCTQILHRFTAMYVALEDMKKANLLLKLSAIAPVVVVLPALFITDKAHILALLYCASTLTALVIGTKLLKMSTHENLLINSITASIEVAKKNYRYLIFSFHQSVNTFLDIISVHADKIIVFQLLGAEATAMYFVAISLPNRCQDIIKQFDLYIFSRFAKYDIQVIQAKLPSRFIISILLAIPVYFLYVAMVPWFFSLFFTQYVDIVYLTQIYALSIFAASALVPLGIIRAHADAKIIYTITGIYSITRPGLILLGIHFWGLEGAIYGATIATLLYAALTYIFALKIKSWLI